MAKRRFASADRAGRGDVRAALAGDLSGEVGEPAFRLVCFARETILFINNGLTGVRGAPRGLPLMMARRSPKLQV